MAIKQSFGVTATWMVLALGASYPVAAQTVSGGSNGIATLEEVVVTANKRVEDVMTVPTAISVLNGGQLEQQGANQFTDYFNRVPGLSAVSGGQPGHAIVSLRGISTGATQVSSTVGFYIDDVPFGSSGSLAIGGILVPDPDLFDVNRVEVLKGPQGTLYGASTLGGLIKVVRNAPILNELSGKVAVEGNSISDGGQGYGVRAVLNAPLSDTIAVRVNVSTRRDAGFIDNVVLGNQDENYTQVTGGRVALLYEPTAEFSAELSIYFQDAKAHGINQTDLDPTTLQPTIGDLKTAENFIRPGDDLKYQVYSAKLDYDLKFATLTSITSLGKYDDHQTLDITDNVGFGPILPNRQQLELDKTTEELRLTSPTNQRFEWLLGGFYTNDDNRWRFDILGLDPVTRAPLVPAFNFYTFDASTTYKESAAFANGTCHFTDQFSLVAGGRYSKNNQDYTYTRSGIAPGGLSTINNNSSDKVFTYAGALQWEPVKQTMAYVRVASGYRPGGPQVSNLQGLGLPNTYDPDTVINYEVGLKSTGLEGQLQFDADVYYIDWRKIQLLNTVVVQTANGPARRSLIANAGTASSRGAELNVRYRPVTALTLGASANYSDAHLNDPAPNLGASAGEQIPYSPKWAATGDINYTFPLGSQINGDLGADVRYVGNRYNYFSHDPSGNARATMPSYTQLDLRGGATYGTWDFALRVNNLTDKRGIIGAQSNAFQAVPPFAVANDTGVYIQPRTFAVVVSKAF